MQRSKKEKASGTPREVRHNWQDHHLWRQIELAQERVGSWSPTDIAKALHIANPVVFAGKGGLHRQTLAKWIGLDENGEKGWTAKVRLRVERGGRVVTIYQSKALVFFIPFLGLLSHQADQCLPLPLVLPSGRRRCNRISVKVTSSYWFGRPRTSRHCYHSRSHHASYPTTSGSRFRLLNFQTMGPSLSPGRTVMELSSEHPEGQKVARQRQRVMRAFVLAGCLCDQTPQHPRCSNRQR